MKKVFTFIIAVIMAASVFAQSPEKMSYQAVIRNNNDALVTKASIGIRISILQGSANGAEVYTETHTTYSNANGLVTIEIGGGEVVLGNFFKIDWASGPYFLQTETDPSGGATYSITGTTQLLSVPYALHAKSVATKLTLNGTAFDLTENRSWNVGTVTSVGLSMPSIFSVSSSPVTGSGTLSAGLASQTANRIFAAPDGSAGMPVFRALTATDIPGIDWSKITTGKPVTLAGYNITDGVKTTGDQNIGGTKTFSNTIVAVKGMNAGSNTITNVANPTQAQDAATKAYVDALLERIEMLEVLNIGFTDSRDGNHYKVVNLGNQIWMAENLKYLPGVSGPATGSTTTPYYYVYGYSGTNVTDAKANSNYAKYGVLYNWPAAMNGAASSATNPSGVQGVCPTGWHLPSDAEWTELTNYLGGESVAGGKLKDTFHWDSPNTAATNETGFTALPGGRRDNTGAFFNTGNYGYWWSATEASSNAWFRGMTADHKDVWRFSHLSRELGFSVRCIQD